MDCTVSVEKLQVALQQVTSVSVKHVSLPILSAVLIEVDSQQMLIRATNLSVGVEARVSAKIQKTGMVAVEAAVLQKIIQSLPVQSQIHMHHTGSVLQLRSEGVEAQVKTVPVDDFPTLPYTQSSDDAFKIDPQVFVEGVRSVVYAAAVSDIKPEIASVYIYGENEEMVFVATDSFRLAERRIAIKNLPTLSGILVPAKNINEIIRVLGTLSEEVQVVLSDHQIAFENKGLFCVSRVIDGVFPDYRQIIPKEHTTQVVALRSDIAKTLKLTSVFSDALQKLTITISPAKKTCVLGTSNDEVGTQSSQLEAALSGDDISLALNQRYLQEGLQTITTDSVTLSCSPGKPLVVTPVGVGGFLYLIMPMRQ